MKKTLLSCAVLGTFSLMGTSAFAEEAAAEAEPDWTFPAGISFVSDYIFRGQSQTWGKPAAQFFIEADHKSGFYAGFAASNVSDNWLPGANLETDLFAGFRGNLPGAMSEVGFDAGVIYYMYPGGNWDESVFDGYNDSNKLDTAEASVALSYKWLTFKTGIALTEYFGWDTNNSPVGAGFNGDLGAGVKGDTSGSYYYEFDGGYEVFPSWTVSGQIGRQVINNATGLDITYYKVGVTKALPKDFSVGIFYSATNEPDAYKDFISLRDGVAHPGHQSDIAKDKVFVSISKSF